MNDRHLPQPSIDRELRIEPATPSPIISRGIERLQSIAASGSEISEHEPEPILLWTLDDPLYRAVQVAGVGDRLLLAGSDDALYVFDATTGTESWHKDFGDWISIPGPDHGNDELIFVSAASIFRALESSTGNERWYFVGDVAWSRIVDSFVIVATRDGQIRALDLEDGRVLWRDAFESRWSSDGGLAAENRCLALAQGACFIDFDSRDEARLVDDHSLRVLDARTGEQLWIKPLDWWDHCSLTFLMVGSTIYIRVFDGTVSALDARTGTERWRFQLTDENSPYAVGVIDDLVLMRGKETFYGINVDTGDIRWQYVFGSFAFFEAVDDGTAYIADSSHRLHAVDVASGIARWILEMNDLGDDDDFPPLAAADGVAYLGSRNRSWHSKEDYRENTLRAIDSRTGTFLWTCELGIDPVESIILTQESTIVQTETALFAFTKLMDPATSPPHARNSFLLDMRIFDRYPEEQERIRQSKNCSPAKFGGPFVLLAETGEA